MSMKKKQFIMNKILKNNKSQAIRTLRGLNIVQFSVIGELYIYVLFQNAITILNKTGIIKRVFKTEEEKNANIKRY